MLSVNFVGGGGRSSFENWGKFLVVAAAFLVSGFFVFDASATVTSLILLSPNGAPVEWRGTRLIEWDATTIAGGSNNISILLSTDSGITYNQLIASPVDATHFYLYQTIRCRLGSG